MDGGGTLGFQKRWPSGFSIFGFLIFAFQTSGRLQEANVTPETKRKENKTCQPQDSGCTYAEGSSIQKELPWSGWEKRPTRPFMSSTARFTTARPMPVPAYSSPRWSFWNMPNMRLVNSGVMPMPLSVTVMRTTEGGDRRSEAGGRRSEGPISVAEMEISGRAPDLVNFKALLIKFV